jgi:hypothetical protein
MGVPLPVVQPGRLEPSRLRELVWVNRWQPRTLEAASGRQSLEKADRPLGTPPG